VIGLTTGREPSQRLNSLLKELADAIPNAKITRRGKSNLDDLGRRFLDDGISHALTIYRSHGGPGRIDLFNVETSGMTPIPPSILLKSVTLRKEYGTHGKYRCAAITYENPTTTTTRLGHALSEILELPEESRTSNSATCSLHIRNNQRGVTELVVASHRTKRDLGPKLVISNLTWKKKE